VTDAPEWTITRVLREGFARAALVIVGVAVALGLIEGGLRLAAAVAPDLFSRARAVRDDGRLRIACVGDSHVYGAFLPPGDAFPEQLDAMLHRRGIAADVYNFGIPGQNSFQVRRRLPRILERVRPGVVIVLVGHNNYWNLSERRVDAPDAGRPWSWRDLRLARMLQVLRVHLRDGAAAARRPDLRMVDDTKLGEHLLLDLGDGIERVDMWRGDRELTPDEAGQVTYDDLTAMVEMIRAAGAIPVLLAYPATLTPQRASVQRAIARAAADTAAFCFDPTALTTRLLRRGVKRLFFPDTHPSARYYRAMAWDLARELVRLGVVSRTDAPRVPAGGGCQPL
jgi:lysophospholipase L1-like esterase